MEKPIVFKNKRGKQLVGILHLPKGKRKFPLVLICHGFGSTKTRRKYVKLARVLTKRGIATFRFDFEGCGDSEGSFETITIKRQVSDLASAAEYALRQKNINKNKIALLGSSLGSVIVALFTAQSKLPVKTLVFWAPAFNQEKLFPIWHTKSILRKWKRQGYFIRKDKKLGISYLRENEKKDYTPILSRVQAPILIIHGKKDETVPLKFSKKLAKEYKNIKLVLYPTDHKFEDYYIQQKLIRDTTRWLNKHLRK